MNSFDRVTKSLTWSMAMLLLVFAAGCGGGQKQIIGGVDIGAAVVPAPTVTSTVPANGNTGVQVNRRITATFSEPTMDSATISAATFTLAASATPASLVAGTVTYAGSSAVFTPNSPLAANAQYTATVTTAVKNQAGVALAANFVWSFTTGFTADTTAPTISSTVAFNGETNLPLNRSATVTFSEPMDPLTLVSPATSFTVCSAGTGLAPAATCGPSVAGVVSYLGNTATFIPNSNLAPNTWYTSTVTTAATDLAGNALAGGLIPNPWSWQTGAAADIIAPTITSTNPANLAAAPGAGTIPINHTVSATFSEPMSLSTMTTVNFTVKETLTNNPVTGTVSYDGQNNIATFTPLASLAADTSYTATVSNGAKDLANNPLAAGAVANPWIFRTATGISPGPAGAAPNLKTVAPFGMIAFDAITNSAGPSHIYGDVALTQPGPGGTIASVTGPGTKDSGVAPLLASSMVTDSYSVPASPGLITAADNGTPARIAALPQLLVDLRSVYDDLMLRAAPVTALTTIASAANVPGGTFAAATDLSGYVLSPGIYTTAVTYGLSNAKGPLVLDAGGNPDAVFIIRSTGLGISGLTSTTGSVVLQGGAQSKNIYWVVDNATIGGSTFFQGTLVAGHAITVLGFANVEGRMLAGALGLVSGAITLTNTNIITVPK